MRWSSFIIVLAIFAASAYAITSINSCQNLNASDLYILNQSISINGSSCFNVTAPNAALDCAGFSIIGNGTANTYGVYSNQTNTTVRNCIIPSFQHGIFFNSSANGTIQNTSVTTSGASWYGIFLLSSSGNLINNITASSGSSGVFLQSSTFNTLNRVVATSSAYVALYIYTASDLNTIANSTIRSDATNAIDMITSSNNTLYGNRLTSNSSTNEILSINTASNNNRFYNNTLNTDNGAGTLLFVRESASGNIFYWNNFTATTGKYVNDTNGSNYYNTTIAGHGEGNVWANVMNGSVQITGTNASVGFPSLYYGTNGSGWPYNLTNSQGKVIGGIVDFAPLTSQQAGSPPQGGEGTNGSVSGYVLNATGSPVNNSMVFLNSSTSFTANTTTNASGFYQFLNLNYSYIGITYSFRAQHPQNASQFTNFTTFVITNSSYQFAERNLSFSSGGQQQGGGGGNGTNGSISGYVLMPFGGIASGANVSLMGAISRSVLSGANGSYSFANLTWPSGYSVQARMDNKVSNFMNINLSSNSYIITQNITLAEQGQGGGCTHNGTYSISGFVRVVNSSGTFNITGSSVGIELKVRNATCGSFDMSCYYESNQSNFSSGAFSVGCLDAGNYTVMAFGGGGQNQQGSGFMMQPLNISITNASISSLDLNLTQDMRGPQGCNGNASINGYVYSNNSGTLTYLSNVQVYAGVSGSTGGSNFCGGGGQTSSSGFYNITGLQAGTYMLNLMPPSGSGLAEVHLSPDQAITLGATEIYQKNFSLSQSGFVTGYIYGNASNGTLVPLSGAWVNVYSTTMGGAWGGGNTNGSGFFNISITPGSGYELSANPPYGSGYSTGRSTGITVTSGQSYNVGNITLRLGARITGYVVNSTGSGIPNVGVNAHPKNMFGAGGGGEWAFTQTNGSGYFSLAGLQANSTYIVEAFPFDPNSNYSSGSGEVTLSDSGSTLNITLVQGNSVSGRVTCNGSNVSFAPVNFMKVDVAGQGPDRMFGTMEAGSFAWASTDQNGLYSVRGISAATFSVRVELPWGSTAYNCSAYTNNSYSVSAGASVLNISLPSAAVLSGKVNDSSGNNVSGAFINAFQPSTTGAQSFGPSAFTQTDSNGNYQLRLSPDAATSYIVSAFPPWGSTYAQQEQRVLFTASSTLNFTLSSGGSIRGKVVNSAGSPIQFAGVNAFSETARSFGYVNTLSDGTFEVRGLSSARDFRLFIQPPSTTGGIVPTFLENIAVAAGQATDVGTINATSADSYLLVTVLEGGSGISSANVHAWRPFTPYFGYCSTNSSGQCNITGLTTGTYDIFVDSAGRPPRFTNATLAAGNNSLAFNYNATGTLYTLNGTVVNSSSGGVANAEVGIWDEATRFGMHTQANGSGFFSFTGVPGSTTYKFGARKPGYLDSLGTVAMEAANKTQNITLNTAAGFLTGGSLITISGTVVSASSASVATKSVVIVDAANASFFNDITVTNSSGQYAFTSVPAQTATITYKLTAVLGNQTFNATQAVTSGQNYTVNITVS